MIDQLRSDKPVGLLCSVFKVSRSCYYAYCRKRRSPDLERLALRVRVNELLTQSRSAAGSRSIMCTMREEGIEIGRFKVRKLMSEMKLMSKQPGSHAYKKATVERPDIPMCWIGSLRFRHRMKSGAQILHMSGLKAAGIM